MSFYVPCIEGLQSLYTIRDAKDHLEEVEGGEFYCLPYSTRGHALESPYSLDLIGRANEQAIREETSALGKNRKHGWYADADNELAMLELLFIHDNLIDYALLADSLYSKLCLEESQRYIDDWGIDELWRLVMRKTTFPLSLRCMEEEEEAPLRDYLAEVYCEHCDTYQGGTLMSEDKARDQVINDLDWKTLCEDYNVDIEDLNL